MNNNYKELEIRFNLHYVKSSRKEIVKIVEMKYEIAVANLTKCSCDLSSE